MPGVPDSSHPWGASTSQCRQRASRSGRSEQLRSKRATSTPLGIESSRSGGSASTFAASSRRCGEIATTRSDLARRGAQAPRPVLAVHPASPIASRRSGAVRPGSGPRRPPSRPAARSAIPARSVPSERAIADRRSICSSIRISVPCRWVTSGVSGNSGRGRLVDGCQVVEVQDRGRAPPTRAPRTLCPRPHDVVADRRARATRTPGRVRPAGPRRRDASARARQ